MAFGPTDPQSPIYWSSDPGVPVVSDLRQYGGLAAAICWPRASRIVGL